MNRTEFLDILHAELNFYDDIDRNDVTEETDLGIFSNWDSLSRATVYNLGENNGITFSHKDLKDCKTVDDILKLAKL